MGSFAESRSAMPRRFKLPGFIRRPAGFYLDGLRSMTLGRSLWLIIALKLVVIFGILKFFFFPDYLGTRFETNRERADFVLEQLTHPQPLSHPGGEQDDRTP